MHRSSFCSGQRIGRRSFGSLDRPYVFRTQPGLLDYARDGSSPKFARSWYDYSDFQCAPNWDYIAEASPYELHQDKFSKHEIESEARKEKKKEKSKKKKAPSIKEIREYMKNIALFHMKQHKDEHKSVYPLLGMPSESESEGEDNGNENGNGNENENGENGHFKKSSEVLKKLGHKSRKRAKELQKELSEAYPIHRQNHRKGKGKNQSKKPPAKRRRTK